MKSSRTTIAVLVLLVAAGCGFQLQGATRYPAELAAVYLDLPDRNSDLAFQLRRTLEAADVRLAGDAAEATATVRIVNENFGRRVKSVSAQNRPTEYEVYYTVEYQVVTPERTLVPREPIARTRIFPYSEREILGKQQEEEMLRESLAREIAGVITRRLAEL
jgi:LPS-assembly lipoprotein